MRILSLTLENFGLYAGRQTIDLRTSVKAGLSKPVILIGGKNGSGKTSFLESVRLALYGRLGIGSRMSQSSYEAYLRARTHIGAEKKICTSSCVELDFEYAESGIVHTYNVCRSWILKSDAVVEQLEVRKDGQIFNAIPKEEWQSFLQELLPYGISQLFFFDGEKITEIADDSSSGQHLSTAVRSLLGIDLIGRLRTDLGLYLAKHQRADTDNSGDLEKLINEAQLLRDELNEASDLRADLLTKLDSERRVANRAQQRFTASGGEVAINRTQLMREKDALLKERQELMTEFREGSSGLWIWLAAPKLRASLSHVISTQHEAQYVDISTQLATKFTAWFDSCDEATRLRWTEEHRADLDNLLQSFCPTNINTSIAVFDAPSNALDLMHRVNEQRLSVKTFMKRFNSVETRLSEIDFAIGRVDETKTNYLLDELLYAEQACGQTQGKLNALQERVKLLQHKLSIIERERERFLASQIHSQRLNRQMELAGRVAGSLAEYEKVLIAKKIRDLESAFVDCFNRLIRKNEFVHSVQIDDVSFQVTLVTNSGAEIPRTSLSAGEKQVFAIAMLWALAKTSGRSFPVIIDTPLARLDSEHRTAIIERYFTEVSHQVIVLSTDTEIDGELADKLKHFVSKHYRLDYIPADRCTKVTQGYFTKIKKRVAIDALQ